MKRSFINSSIEAGLEFLKKMRFVPPPFVYWGPEEWMEKGHEYDEIRNCML